MQSSSQLRAGRVQPYDPGLDCVQELAADVPHEIIEQQLAEEQPWKTVEELLVRIVEELETYDQRHHQTLLEMQQVAIELAVAAASHLVYSKIESDDFGIEDLVRSAIAPATDEHAVTVVLNPLDHELLQRRQTQLAPADDLAGVAFQTDETLPRGSCRVVSAAGAAWQSDISERLANIRKHWLDEFDESQVERRKTQDSDSSLRRFPDRRETA